MSVRTPSLDVRPLGRADGDRMLAVNRACLITADFTFVFERSPDFFAWPDAVFDDYLYVGGFREGELRAYALFAVARGRAPHGDAFAWSGDVRVLPGERGSGFLQAASSAAADILPPSGVGLALIKRGNQAATRALGRVRLPAIEISRLGEFRAVSLLLAREQRERPVCQVRHAVPGDVPALADLMQRAYGDRPFAPLVTPDELVRDAKHLPGFGLDRYYLAFRAGRLIGALGAWDADAVRRIAVLHYPWRARAVRVAYSGARVFLRRAAPLPAPGQCFRAITTTRVAVPDGDPAVLHDLLLAVHADHLGGGHHMIHVGFTGDDPLEAGTRGFMRHTFRSDLVLTATREGAKSVRSGPRPYLDLRYL